MGNQTEPFQQSSLKKKFVALIKKVGVLSPQESVLRSLSILIDIVKFDVEVFKASLGVSYLWKPSLYSLFRPVGHLQLISLSDQRLGSPIE